MMDPNISLEEAREFFKNDHFATEACGCRVVEASPGHAVCEFDIEKKHLNGFGGVMGGAIFTLADFAVAIASNIGEEPSACVVCSIQFMKGAKGDKLIATASTDRSGRTLGFYTIDVVDNLGTKVAKMTATCSRKPKA